MPTGTPLAFSFAPTKDWATECPRPLLHDDDTIAMVMNAREDKPVLCLANLKKNGTGKGHQLAYRAWWECLKKAVEKGSEDAEVPLMKILEAATKKGGICFVLTTQLCHNIAEAIERTAK